MRRWIAAVLSAALCVLSGCSGQGLFPYAREMGDAALLRTMGVDGTHTQVELTVSTGSSGANTQPALVLSAEGPSLGMASQRIQGLGDAFVFYGYVDQLLLSVKYRIRQLAGDKSKWYGLDTSSMLVETVPLLVGSGNYGRRIQRADKNLEK